VIWPNYVFQTDYELKSNFKIQSAYDVISMTSSLLRHRERTQDFPILSPSQSKFLWLRQCGKN